MKPTRDLCIMACIFCRDKQFHAWLASIEPGKVDESTAKHFILIVCGVPSRNDLDTNQEAAKRFHAHIRDPFLAWKESQQ